MEFRIQNPEVLALANELANRARRLQLARQFVVQEVRSTLDAFGTNATRENNLLGLAQP